MNLLDCYHRNMHWIHSHTIDEGGIAVTSEQNIIYPEVTGYYIPTLLAWGERELALSYAQYLCGIQKPDGSWYDAGGNSPYIFDTAQVLKGLLAVREIEPQTDKAIQKGCEWLIGNITPQGRLAPPREDTFGENDDFYSELIHLYCLTPLRDAAGVYGRPDWQECVDKVLEYYKTHYRDRILHFGLLSHFYAYVIEGLVDLGEESLAREAMKNLDIYAGRSGKIPGLYDVPWVCSTGLFQLALVWYKLGEVLRGDTLFAYACKLQNRSGGWYGSYPASFAGRFARGRRKPYYFPREEISWANKYFLDALQWKMCLHFEEQSSSFLEQIEKEDERYQLVLKELSSAGQGLKICDAGCGKGRYLRNLLEDLPQHAYYAVDCSAKVMSHLPKEVQKRQGTLTCLPWPDSFFDCIYVCEALKHAGNIEGSLRELWRTTRAEGKIIVIDKPVEALGRMRLDEMEQWIDSRVIRQTAAHLGGTLRIVKNVGYEGKKDGLFQAWIIEKEK